MTTLTQFVWVDPTTNVDGSAVTAGEISGYQIGIRAASGTPGTYTTFAIVKDAAATSEAFSLLGTTLAPGDYAAAIQTLSTTNGNSPFSPEAKFTIDVPLSPPNAPTGFTVA